MSIPEFLSLAQRRDKVAYRQLIEATQDLRSWLGCARHHKLSAYEASYFRLTEERGKDLVSQDPDFLTRRTQCPWIKALDAT